MPMSREPVLHLPVTLRTRQHCFLVYSVLGEGDSVLGELLARLLIGEPDTVLTSGPVSPAILFPELFGPGRGC